MNLWNRIGPLFELYKGQVIREIDKFILRTDLSMPEEHTLIY